VEVKGVDAIKFLHNMTTKNITEFSRSKKHAAPALFLNNKGRIVAVTNIVKGIN